MTSMNTHTDQAATTARSLLGFTAVALPAGWTFLSVPLFTGWPIEHFVLATLFLGVVPAALLIPVATRLVDSAAGGGGEVTSSHLVHLAVDADPDWIRYIVTLGLGPGALSAPSLRSGNSGKVVTR